VLASRPILSQNNREVRSLVLALVFAPALAHAGKPRASRPMVHSSAKQPARITPGATVTPAPEPGDPDAQRILKLQDQLKSILHEKPFSAASVGVEVMSAQKNQLLFAHNADRLFDPASNEKILTTATALAKLGPEYRYRTVLFGPAPDESGVVSGDVYLRGSGDPSLVTQHLVDLAAALVRSGVRRISGGVMVDERAFDRRSGAPVDTNSATGDNLGYAAITLNRNTLAVRVRAGQAGEKPDVVVDP